jgi:Domain of unknown function (DUF6265)
MTIRSTTLAALGALLFLPSLSPVTLVQQARGAGVPSAAARAVADVTSAASPPPASPSPAKPTLADFAWLTGRWQGVWGPRIAQQVWTSPKAGVMLGTFQLAENDKTLVLELFTIVEDSDGIKFHLRHFTPSLVAWEKPGPTALNLMNADPKIIAFENPTDGQPKHITITRTDADTYVSRSEIVPQQGETQVTEITYHRQKDAPPAHH